MDDKRLVRISKFLSKYLRHDPAGLGLTLTAGGWVPIDALIEGSRNAGFHFTREELDIVVAKNNKQRFSIDETGTQIRANQGHSVEVDLQLEPVTPPDVLYHGTAERFLAEILKSGILKMSRHHVHLSGDAQTANAVGSRHGKPAILRIDSGTMARDGYVFYRTDNGVWLTESVPPQYISPEFGSKQ
jgi:putative RNA 2'-phosphotransferase